MILLPVHKCKSNHYRFNTRLNSYILRTYMHLHTDAWIHTHIVTCIHSYIHTCIASYVTFSHLCPQVKRKSGEHITQYMFTSECSKLYGLNRKSITMELRSQVLEWWSCTALALNPDCSGSWQHLLKSTNRCSYSYWR